MVSQFAPSNSEQEPSTPEPSPRQEPGPVQNPEIDPSTVPDNPDSLPNFENLPGRPPKEIGKRQFHLIAGIRRKIRRLRPHQKSRQHRKALQKHINRFRALQRT
jgi:hypothetical protein